MRSFAFSIFSDDIRFEIDNKVSLIGCYSGILDVSYEADGFILPKLGIFITINLIPTDIPREVTIKVERDDGVEELFSQVFTIESENSQQVSHSADTVDQGENDKYLTIKVPLVFSPVPMREGKISTRIHYNDNILKAGSLLIRRVPSINSNNV